MEKNLLPRMVGTLVYLTHCALHGKKAEARRLDGVDMQRVLLLAQEQSMVAMAAWALDGVLEGEALAPWKEARERALRRNLLLDMERRQICAVMEQKGIWYMPLKGSVMKDLYPKMEMRQMTDQDILFDTSRREEMREFMLARGYDPKGHSDTHHDIYHKDPVYNIELHHTLFEKCCELQLVDYYENVKDRMIPNAPGSFGHHFSDEDFYLYLMAHAYKHYTDHGVGLRSIVDVYVYQQAKPELDWAYVEQESRKLGMAEYEKLCRSVAGKLFGSEVPEPLDEEEYALVKFCCASGTHGSEHGFIDHELQKLGDGEKIGFGAKVKYLWRRLFPSAQWMKQKDKRLRKHPWLLPFAWIARLFRGVFKEGGHTAKELKYVMDKDGGK